LIERVLISHYAVGGILLLGALSASRLMVGARVIFARVIAGNRFAPGSHACAPLSPSPVTVSNKTELSSL
jgi:hypothetical protein